ncbi:CAP domain-containing protein [Marinicella sp. W31]|uniref:CAP domain-containing protein n=1 Tax=Marinicella sp. W31 TaxID=3023713 RepID=UPI003756D9AA
MRLAILITLMASIHSASAETEELICGNHALAQQLAQLIINDPQQNRQQLICDSELTKIAHLKAQQMAEAQSVSHDVNNTWPNQLLRNNGFKLPKEYGLFANNVESLAGGKDIPEEVLGDFLGSDLHRVHILGTEGIYTEQDKIGVAYVRDPWTLHVDYWVVLIATDKQSESAQVVKSTVSQSYKDNLILSLRENNKEKKIKHGRKSAYERRVKEKRGAPE